VNYFTVDRRDLRLQKKDTIMATKNVVKNVADSSTQVGGFDRAYSAKVDAAYGKITAADYQVGDTLSFVEVNAKDIVHAKFVSNGYSVEVFSQTSLASPITFDIHNAAVQADIYYAIHFVRGTPAYPIKLTITSSS